MKRKTYILLAALAVTVSAAAQEGFSRRVDITRDYTVGVQSADKLSTPVQQADTVIARPTLSFGIRPTEWNSSFVAAPLQTASLSASEWVRQNDFYLKAAAGYPWRSALDFYYTPLRERRSTLGLYLNHDGIEGKVTNLMDERVSALSLQNRIGAFYEHYGRLSTFTLDVSDRYELYNPYGGYLLPTSSPSTRENIIYNRLSGAAKMAGRFSDADDLSYEAVLGAQYLHGKSYGSSHNCTDYDFAFDLQGIGGDSTSLVIPSGIRFAHSACLCPIDGYHNATVSIAPEWHFRFGGFPLNIAVGYLYNSNLASARNNFIFDVDCRYDRKALLTPFLAASRQLINNDFDRLVEHNPYLMFGLEIPNAMKTSLKTGIEGATPAFSYRLSGGAERYDNYTSFCLVEGPLGQFEPISTPLTLWYAAAEIELRTSASFVVNLSGRMNFPKYDTEPAIRNAVGIPDFEVDADLEWSVARRLVLRAGVELRGKSDHLIHYGAAIPTTYAPFEVRTLPATCNLKASAEYSFNDTVSAFVEADNILNQTIYNYLSYRRLGFGLMGGVKMTF